MQRLHGNIVYVHRHSTSLYHACVLLLDGLNGRLKWVYSIILLNALVAQLVEQLICNQ